MHRPIQREIMFARFKPQPQPQPTSRRPNSNPTPSPSQTNVNRHAAPSVLIQRLIILHDGLMPLPEEEENLKHDSTDASKPTLQRRNPQAALSEDASLEEHGEFILYYYNHSLHSSRDGDQQQQQQQQQSINSTTTIRQHCTEEAVKFAGLCRALRSLPLALHPQSCNAGVDGDETDAVHLSDSTLIYVPLELNGDVVAVVQIPRASNHRRERHQSQTNTVQGRSCVGYGADAMAVRDAVRHCHALFSMIYGGGIHQRLLQTEHLQNYNDMCTDLNERSKSSDTKQIKEQKLSTSRSGRAYRYGGMMELFQLRRNDRKLTRSNSEENHTGRSLWMRKSNPTDAFEDIADQIGRIACQDQIDSLLQILPITSLRKDIQVYYDEWLDKMQGMCASIEGGVGRCIVEMVPKPIRRHGVRGQYPPVSPAPFVCLAGAEFIRSILAEEICINEKQSESEVFRLWGLGLFYQKRYVSSEFLQHTEHGDERKETTVSPEILCMIAEYMLSHQRGGSEFKSRGLKQNHASVSSTNPTPVHNPLDRWLSNISSGSNKSDTAKANSLPSNFATMNGHMSNHDAHETNGFVAPPVGKKSIDTLSVHGLGYEIWLPRFRIPQMPIDMNENDDLSNVQTPVTLFSRGEFDFLLLFKGRPNGKFACNILTMLSNRLSRFCDEYSYISKDSSFESTPKKYIDNDFLFVGEQGMDIVYVNRQENTFMLLSQHDLSSNDVQRRANTPPSNESNQSKGLFGLGFKIKENCERENEVSLLLSQSPSHLSLLDCRHKLAAHLPLDVMLAFDDMFNEIGRQCCRQSEANQLKSDNLLGDRHCFSSNKTVELCTYLPQGWVYCRACRSHELYILLDTSKFVTISDVTKAVTRVRERMLNDKLH